MGKNTGDGFRQGQQKDRKQIFNQKTGQYIKIDTETGKFMSSKETPFKGVRMKKISKEPINSSKFTN
jgi:hypothetical protein|tara:strand:- start:158 stop:358 length:201 start_codon:yes stop_codon:yes gene_type:complete